MNFYVFISCFTRFLSKTALDVEPATAGHACWAAFRSVLRAGCAVSSELNGSCRTTFFRPERQINLTKMLSSLTIAATFMKF